MYSTHAEKLNILHLICLRRIFRIRWYDRIRHRGPPTHRNAKHSHPSNDALAAMGEVCGALGSLSARTSLLWGTQHRKVPHSACRSSPPTSVRPSHSVLHNSNPDLHSHLFPSPLSPTLFPLSPISSCLLFELLISSPCYGHTINTVVLQFRFSVSVSTP